MSVSMYLRLETYVPGEILAGESPVVLPSGAGNPLGPASAGAQGLVEALSVSYSMEQTLNIGSQSSGAGAGKVTFNPLAVTKRVDQTSPVLWEMLCSGTPFKTLKVFFLRNVGASSKGSLYLRLDLSLAAVKTISLSAGAEGEPLETVTFESGGMQLWYAAQSPDGSLGKVATGGWDRVRNVKAEGPLS